MNNERQLQDPHDNPPIVAPLPHQMPLGRWALGRWALDKWGLTPGDQAVVAGLLCICLAATTYRVLWTVGPGPQMVRIEKLPSRRIDYRIDINTTDWPPLDLLPGVSEKMAQRIVEYRETHGPFRQPHELQQIPGIGPKFIERLRPHLVGWTGTQTSR